ncbi:MAG: CopD family protein [Nevskia sp.]|nr:CopD family protein [Nevskia sp.]
MGLAFALHVLSAVVWVGGMFFAYLCLRPSLAEMMPAERAALWVRVLGRFFGWVLAIVPALLASGIGMMLLSGGMAAAGIRVHVMMALGIVMMLLFLHVYFAPFQRLKRAVAGGDVRHAAEQVGSIRRLVAVNLSLGILVVLVATAGKYLLN